MSVCVCVWICNSSESFDVKSECDCEKDAVIVRMSWVAVLRVAVCVVMAAEATGSSTHTQRKKRMLSFYPYICTCTYINTCTSIH